MNQNDTNANATDDAQTTTETILLMSVSHFPTDIKHPETDEWVRIVGYHRPTKYGPGVYAYVDPETGDYGGMLTAYDDTESASPLVEARRVSETEVSD